MWLMLTVMMWPMERESVMLHQFLMETATIVMGENVNQVKSKDNNHNIKLDWKVEG